MTKSDELNIAELARSATYIQAQAFCRGTKAWAEFAEAKMVPLLGGLLTLNNKERAVVGTYYRMYLWMRSLADLKSVVHFQAAAAGARTTFELLLDMKLVAVDETGQSVERFHAFSEIEKYRVAKKHVEFCEANPTTKKYGFSQRQKYVQASGREQRVLRTVVRLWGTNRKGKPNWPKHWTGKDIPGRLRGLPLEYREFYHWLYPVLSWYIHAGSTAYVGFSTEGLEAALGISHSVAQEMFHEASLICATETKLITAAEWLRESFDELKGAPLRGLTPKQVKILKKVKLVDY